MVILKNIRKTQDSISADYYPEGKTPSGYMELRLSDSEIIKHEVSGCLAPAHVLRELKRLAKLDNPPTEKTVLWY